MMTGPTTKESYTAVEQRRVMRLRLTGELNGGLPPQREPLTILDLSRRGFAVQALVGFVSDREYVFEFSAAGRRYRPLKARSVRCVRVTPANGDHEYVTGFAFVAADDVDAQTIDGIVRDVQHTHLDLGGLVGAADGR